MKWFIILFGILIVLGGISLIISPDYIFGIFEDTQDYSVIYIPAIAIRAVFGILLISAANQSKHPLANKIIGGIALSAAITFIIVGREGFSNMVIEILSVMKPFARFTGLFVLAFGVYLIYSFTGKKQEIKT